MLKWGHFSFLNSVTKLADQANIVFALGITEASNKVVGGGGVFSPIICKY